VKLPCYGVVAVPTMGDNKGDPKVNGEVASSNSQHDITSTWSAIVTMMQLSIPRKQIIYVDFFSPLQRTGTFPSIS
jgi:hypothetical protein